MKVSACEGNVTNFPPIEIMLMKINYLDMRLHSSDMRLHSSRHPTMHLVFLLTTFYKIIESYPSVSF